MTRLNLLVSSLWPSERIVYSACLAFVIGAAVQHVSEPRYQDVTVTLQTAIDACIIGLPPGTYNVSDTIIISGSTFDEEVEAPRPATSYSPDGVPFIELPEMTEGEEKP